MNLHLLPLLCLPLVALAQSAAERTVYTCDNGSRIEIAFASASDGRPLAELHFADETITLPQVPAASGALYRNETIRLHTRDDQALFEDGKGNARRCTQGNSGPPAPRPAGSTPPVAASSFIDIGGSVSFRSPGALPAAAVLLIRVQDISRAGAPARILAEQRIALAGQPVPIPFATSIDRDLVGKKTHVVISARIEQAGKLLFVNDKVYPALSNGQPSPQHIQLKQVAGASRH